MKKFVGVVLSIFIILELSAVGYADNGNFTLNFDGNSYTVEEAASGSSSLPFGVSTQDGTVVLSDAETGLNLHVKYDVLDDDFFAGLSGYFNDSKASKDDLFSRYVELQKTYIASLNDYYRTSFLYGDSGNPDTESSMKLFTSGGASLFGQEGYVYLYNVEKAERLQYTEDTQLVFIVPVPSEYSVITIQADFNHEKLDQVLAEKLEQMIGSLRFGDLPPQTDVPELLTQQGLWEKVRAGIYPERTSPQKEPGTVDLSDNIDDFTLSIPDTFVPYVDNSIGDEEHFYSFKTAPNRIFSLAIGRLNTVPGENGDIRKVDDVISDKIASISELYKGSIIGAEVSTDSIGGKTYTSFKYELSENGGTTYITDFYTLSDKALYRFELKTRFETPTDEQLQEFRDILATLRPDPGISTEAALKTPAASGSDLQNFTSGTEGYAFDYPAGWKLSDIAGNISYDEYKLTLPEISGGLEVYVSEGQINPGLEADDLAACLLGQDAGIADKYLKKYTPPYKGCNSKLLDISSSKSGNTTRLYRLVAYMDQNGRSKLASSVDLVQGQKIYSMFVVANESSTIGGKLKDEGINSDIASIISSFRTSNEKSQGAVNSTAELRNGKVVFVEDALGKMLDTKLDLTTVNDFLPDGSFYVTADNSNQSGFYRVKLDYTARTLIAQDRMLKSTILNTESKKLLQGYNQSQVKSVKLDEKAMTIAIETAYLKSAPSFVSTYGVTVNLTDKGISWDTARLNQAEELKNDSKIYLDSIFGVDTKLNFENSQVFSNISSYAVQGLNYNFAVHVQLKNSSGIAIFSVNTANDSILSLQYKPLDSLETEICTNNGLSSQGYTVKSYSWDDDQFSITLNLEKKSENGIEKVSHKFHITYNLESERLESVPAG